MFGFGCGHVAWYGILGLVLGGDVGVENDNDNELCWELCSAAWIVERTKMIQYLIACKSTVDSCWRNSRVKGRSLWRLVLESVSSLTHL